MKTQIITTAEIKVLLGISDSSQDAMLEMANDFMTEILLDLLGLDNFDVTAYIDEEINIYDNGYLEFKNYPIEITSPVPTFKDTNFTALTSYPDSWFLEDDQKPFIKGKNSAGNLFEWCKGRLLVSYTAGWKVVSTFTVADYSSMANKTFSVKVAGTTTEWTMKASGATGNQIDVGASNDLTATSIATALGGTASGAVVTLPAGHYLTFGTMTSTEGSVDNFDLPNSFRVAVSMLVGGFVAGKQKQGGVESYSLGGKSVSFGTQADFKLFEQTVQAYLPSSKRFNCV